MAFNIGLSGLRASQVDLDVTGNNIANASTVGFKGSQAQFGDLYSSGFLSSGNMSVGGGVKVQDVKQSFGQGSISGTQNGLDMAIDGDGFFVLNNNGQVQYSRAGQFSIDKDGFVTNNQSMRVQGYQADEDGNLSGVRGDLQIDTDNLEPRRTTRFDSQLNLDSRESVLEVVTQTFPSPGVPATGETVEFTYPDGRSVPLEFAAGESAQSVAGKLNELDGVSASARTTLTIPDNSTFSAGDSYLVMGELFTIPSSGIAGPGDARDWLQDAINASPLSTLNATSEGATGLRLIDSRGNPFSVQVADASGTAASPQPGAFPYDGAEEITNLTVDEGIAIRVDPNGGADEADYVSDTTTSEILGATAPTTTRRNSFNPDDQRTYNHATSSTIYDSLGNPHTMTQYFVKEPVSGGDSVWAMYVQIDDEDVGDPPFTSGDPTRARFELEFNSDGSISSVDGDPNGQVLISNWTPKDDSGQPNGADGPLPIANGGQLPIAEPPVSSNFMVDMNDTTQYGSSFGVIDQQQNGYTTGRLSGLDVSGEGVIFARYSNGQSQNLGQVALASFANTDGLSPVGDTNWVETFESGQPIYGQPGTGTLGGIASSSVEESNVDLSQELVNLIIAQRNYQANAKTIETSDAVTQTIINLR
ncbi:flagellar hook protein FlgE [Marinobacter lacisalsi]|uniref:Flagellar hook protein FlgE n=1 Tax=Marinobacter lacisalsi TaxID=475979 RepID=A0ABV8QEX4_9GAMM